MPVNSFRRKIQRYGLKRTNRGTSLIEVAIAGMILIPLALCMLDLLVFVTTSSINEGAAKTAARAAANQKDQASAFAAAQKALNDYQPTTVATITLINCTWSDDKVVVQTQVQVRLPVPFPGITQETVMAQATEPVVSLTE
jgi:Flp pilus assembly protein TadG